MQHWKSVVMLNVANNPFMLSVVVPICKIIYLFFTFAPLSFNANDGRPPVKDLKFLFFFYH